MKYIKLFSDLKIRNELERRGGRVFIFRRIDLIVRGK